MNLYCIYDRKGELANPPFTSPNHALAIRQFAVACNQPGSAERPNLFSTYPEDFCLMFIGELDEKTMVFKAPDLITNLGLALDFIKKE